MGDDEVERLDLGSHELVHPVELLLELRVGLEVPAAAWGRPGVPAAPSGRPSASCPGGDAVLRHPGVERASWGPEGPVPDSGRGTGDPTIALNTPDLNFTCHPAVSVPLGLDDAGVPFGLQVVAPRFADGLALGLAAALEAERPWPTVAPGFGSDWPW